MTGAHDDFEEWRRRYSDALSERDIYARIIAEKVVLGDKPPHTWVLAYKAAADEADRLYKEYISAGAHSGLG